MKKIVYFLLLMLLCFSNGCQNGKKTEIEETQKTKRDLPKKDRGGMESPGDSGGSIAPERKITAEMAYEGVSNYCHQAYDWSIAEDNPSMMYVKMGEETESEYQVVFRSYTGAFVCFYVEKTSGTTRMVERVPTLGVEEESGTIDLLDYIK